MNAESLLIEKEKLEKRLAWLGVRSTGSDLIEKRIREIDKLLGFDLRHVGGR